ncbi:MAG: AAA domain-containing protein [Catenulispora sp.]|nr:AAA domain-containing protein [Catenulispora sp.]
MKDWWIFKGEGVPHRRIEQLPPPMASRAFGGSPLVEPPSGADPVAVGRLGRPEAEHRLLLSDEDLDLINAAILWRRPLLVTGKPGSGKSSLAYAIARELSLGPVLHWPITSRTTLKEGLYGYDALARLEETNLRRILGEDAAPDLGEYIRLGPLGTALLPQRFPRVLLIDELDKSDLDLPNDLLHVFEEGEFEIDELVRQRGASGPVEVGAIGRPPVAVHDGHVRCNAFPIVVLTDNGERDFSAAFLRRCVRLKLADPDRERLLNIVEAHLGPEGVQAGRPLIEEFLAKRRLGTVATDQLLGAVYLAVAAKLVGTDRAELADRIMAPLDQVG